MSLKFTIGREIGNSNVLSFKEELLLLKNCEEIKEDNEEENMSFPLKMLVTNSIKNLKIFMAFYEIPCNDEKKSHTKIWFWTTCEQCGYFVMDDFDSRNYAWIFENKFLHEIKTSGIKTPSSIVCIIENDHPFNNNERVNRLYKNYRKHGIYRIILPGKMQLNITSIIEDFQLHYEDINIKNRLSNDSKNNSNILKAWQKIALGPKMQFFSKTITTTFNTIVKEEVFQFYIFMLFQYKNLKFNYYF